MSAIEPRTSYGLVATCWALLGVVLSLQLIGGGLDIPALNWFSAWLDAPPHRSFYYIPLAGGVLLIGTLAIYLRRLDPFAGRRWPIWVFLNLFAFTSFPAAELVALDPHLTWMSRIAAPAVGVGFPLFVILAEWLLARLFRRLGMSAHDRGWRGAALRFLRTSLRFRPGHLATLRLAGLLYVDADECAAAVRLLDQLGHPRQQDETRVVRAMERCFRSLGEIDRALDCLLRLRELEPATPNIDKRILDDYVRLGRDQEALDLLEQGRLRENMDLLRLRERLNVKLGNYAQALEQIRQIAEQEGAPYDNAIALYRELLEQLPENNEIRIQLAQLMLSDVAETRRREGAALLEQVVERDPTRLHLSRQLVRYYSESSQLPRAREHLHRLVDAGDPDPEHYLTYAQLLLDEEEQDRARAILERMIEIVPEDWRGHARLGRLLLRQGDLPGAEARLRDAEERVPPDADQSLLQSLRNDLARRRAEQAIEQMTSALRERGEDTGRRLELIDALIDLGRADAIIEHCETLLELSPALREIIELKLRKAIDRIQQSYRLSDYLGDLYFQEGRFDDLLALYARMSDKALNPDALLIDGCRRILGRAPDHLAARRMLAQACRNVEDWSGIRAALEPPMRARNPGLSAEDRALWVEAAFRLGDLEEASNVGLTLIDEMAADETFMLMLIEIQQRLDDHELAWEVYETALQANPENRTLRKMGDRMEQNRSDYRMRRLEERFRSGEMTAAEHFEKAELHSERGEYEHAIKHYQRAGAEEKLADVAMSKMAVTLCDRGMFDMADEVMSSMELTRETVARHPELLDNTYIVARMLEKIRQPERAVKYYKRIFHLDAAYADVVERLERLS
ncbi:MAG TPA: tetratricopeptide repeat protein [Candidatus Sumerlaeota bacterium]|nr:tetratricopeptide repeat protein [Candidatus Sumerlaeota bacterium]